MESLQPIVTMDIGDALKLKLFLEAEDREIDMWVGGVATISLIKTFGVLVLPYESKGKGEEFS